MDSISVIFCRNKKPFSLLIRLFTWSRWSHCGIIHGDKVIESKAPEGVVLTDIDKFKNRYSQWVIVEIPIKNCKKTSITLALEELGKTYDFLSLIGMLFRIKINSSGWFCSELVAHCTGLFRQDRINRITPETLWSISYDIVR